jgi:hypothetical protein
MYRGSRLAASFLLFLTGTAATAIGLAVVPSLVEAWPVVALAVAFGIAHFVALFGIARGREWGRTLGVAIAEAAGGISFAALIAIAMGANPFAGSSLPSQQALANGTGLVAWSLAMYVLLGISAGRVQFEGWKRRSAWWPTPLLGAA